MEKYSQFRDKGTGIAPFFPIPTTPSGIYLPFHIFLFIIRIPILTTVVLAYFLIFTWLPIGSLGKKAALWMILGVPGIWWVDLQIDGVRRGTLATTKASSRLPQPSSIIVSSSTSPIDALYLAAIFDPIFTHSYPSTRLLRPTTLLSSIISALLPPSLHPPKTTTTKTSTPSPSSSGDDSLTTLARLIRANPSRTILLLPECTTTNGRAILPLSPSLLTAPRGTKIYPISLRYAAPDVTTPVPGWSEALRFLWNLCSRPTHTIRVRVAEAVVVDTEGEEEVDGSLTRRRRDAAGEEEDEEEEDDDGNEEEDEGTERATLTAEEKMVLDRVGEALARLGRVKRVGVGVRQKLEFLKVWQKRRR